MSQFIEFVGNHWLLFLALILILGLLIRSFIVEGKGSVGPLQATDLINHRDAVVIDVRPAADYARGHILNAINLPMNGFANQLGTLSKYKGRPIIVNCRSGAQSSLACVQLRKAGFTEVYNLQGGILAWEASGLPLSHKKQR
ncbi:rhodanese-like domain-containing protein [Caldichromatium japonicum]|uniref:Rhodanese-like domain-containing protein n=1 Tax=Caldichromatium japonicum TaxID=2699430 RepID=A0A6G7VAC3_9GAMM|nr:rhodanese-like domain-containing protein [Caldichromatium japonicum]QIK36816.1 rhodanese-like domain-containing protein [Caldichromatium japonicum]